MQVLQIDAQIENLCLAISKSSTRHSFATRLGELCRWNKENRRKVAKCGGLQALVAVLSSSARSKNIQDVTAIANTLSILALDTDNKRIMVDPALQGGGCDVISIVRLCMFQLCQGGHGGQAIKYVAPPTNAGVPTVCLTALAKLIWNVSNVGSDYEWDAATNTDNSNHNSDGNNNQKNEQTSSSLIVLLVSEFLWLSDQLRMSSGDQMSAKNKASTRGVSEVSEARYQILGALWSLSTSIGKWNDDQAMSFEPLLTEIVILIDTAAATNNDDAHNNDTTMVTNDRTPEVNYESAVGGLHDAFTRNVCTAGIGLLGNLLDNSSLLLKIRNQKMKDGYCERVLMRLLTVAKKDDCDHIANLAFSALSKLLPDPV